MRSHIYCREKVANTERRLGSAQEYYPATVHFAFASRPALFTESQIMEAVDRARANPEDLPAPTLWDRLFGWLR